MRKTKTITAAGLSFLSFTIQARIISDCVPGGNSDPPRYNYHADLDFTTFIDYLYWPFSTRIIKTYLPLCSPELAPVLIEIPLLLFWLREVRGGGPVGPAGLSAEISLSFSWWLPPNNCRVREGQRKLVELQIQSSIGSFNGLMYAPCLKFFCFDSDVFTIEMN